MVRLIEEYCKKKGITLAELERELGFGKGSICKWDVSEPSFDRVVKVSKYFKIPLTKLAEVKQAEE